MKRNPTRKPRTLLTLFTIATALATASVTLSTPEATAASESTVSSIIPRGSTWSYSHTGSAPASYWRTGAVSGWSTGSAPFGKGRDLGKVNTTFTAPADGSRPLSAYFQKTFTLTSDLPEWSWLNTWADDGIVVWVNGVEVGRKNAPSSTITHTSYATKAPSSASARKNPVTFTVPARALRAGTNTIAVQVLSNWRATPNITFDAHLVREDTTRSATPTPTKPAPDSIVTPPGPTWSPRAVRPSAPTAPVSPSPKPVAPAPTPVAPQDPGVRDGWGAPDWRDEFDYISPTTGRPAVDPENWNVRGRDDLGLLFDAAVVDRDKVAVEDGVLHIRADWLPTPVRRPVSQSGPTELWHETGYLDQRHLGSDDVSMGQRYGRWEIRAKTPTGPNTRGALAAFWLRNDQSGEIDIMEAWGQGGIMPTEYQRWIKDTAVTTIHTETDGSGRKRLWRHAEQGSPAVAWDDFHTYAFELTPTYAATYVDGLEIMRVTPQTYPDLWNTEYFGSPLHMRMNLHVGPSEQYWGLPDPTAKHLTQNLDFQIDYVRVWKYSGS